jgi:hypothetical protein
MAARIWNRGVYDPIRVDHQRWSEKLIRAYWTNMLNIFIRMLQSDGHKYCLIQSPLQETPGILYVIRCLDIRGIAWALCGERGMSCYRKRCGIRNR